MGKLVTLDEHRAIKEIIFMLNLSSFRILYFFSIKSVIF